jgi:hypothetical protein
MYKAVILTTTFIGISNGPLFSIYSDVDSYVTPFETGITATQLNSGYISIVVPYTATKLKLKSNSSCPSFPTSGQSIVLIPIPTPTPTPLNNYFLQNELGNNIDGENNENIQIQY